MQALQSPASPTQSATGGVSPGWQIGYSAFGLFGLIVLGAFGTLFAICLMRAKQRYAIGDYVPNNYDDWERAYRLTRPQPRRKWWRVLLENFCCCFGVKPKPFNINALLEEEGRLPVPLTTLKAPSPPLPPLPPWPPASPPPLPQLPPLPSPSGSWDSGGGAPKTTRPWYKTMWKPKAK
ncbi:hypothetical protein BDV34DRAFT_220195 [Aspergillus parasiticus]|uniref:Uncharacterized protein n=1 Tax=Aspergillus parasiticus TaxID=5067 RepID=A0A5N6E1F6_ASPPA|nr:hypothetical protein BDV34DRAFT_220195 [Aspergillus parasiticus]